MRSRVCFVLAFAGFVSSSSVVPTLAAESESAAATLPLKEVILYSSGVGYFQRTGEVDGTARLDLRFKVEDINDLLKSMVVQDFDGGKVGSVSYGSRDPLEKTLKSFAVDLTTHPTLGQLLTQVRGERVEVARPGVLTGTILGVEEKAVPAGDDRMVMIEHLNLLTEGGLVSIPLNQILRIQLLDEKLNLELRQALETLARSHDTQKKTVSVTFDGQGRRKVAIGYIAASPVWKTSYRLVIQDEKDPFLQGWAIVENTTDEDWSDVRLSLVSGRPISFTMDLYQPLYAKRPVVEPELYAALRPQLHEDTMELGRRVETTRDTRRERMAPMRSAGIAGAPAAAAPTAAYAFQKEALQRGVEGVALADAATEELNLAQGAAAASGSGIGELFQYRIATPVTLSRQQSAMLPIVSQNVEGEKLAIYNANVHPKRPLNAFRLKNTSEFYLMQGPVTVFEGNSYAGDARIEDLAPGQDRLLSYSMDLKTEVEAQTGAGRQEWVSVRLRKGTLISTRKLTEEKTYNVRNRDVRDKTVLIEHPFRSDWDLVEPTEARERTAQIYRFAVETAAGATAKLEVREQRNLVEEIQIVNLDSNLIGFYLRGQMTSDRVKAALERVVRMRDELNLAAAERARREQQVQEITQEQVRIRENMGRLDRNSELYARYTKKLDQQETELEALREQIRRYRDEEAKRGKALNDFLLELDVE
jgi:hypothetical protein